VALAGLISLALISALLVLAGAVERVVHRRKLRRIPIRIHVNGTRGKSSVTRLIAAGLREAGIRTCAKTTGTMARFILPDGRELPVYRPSGPTVIEQKRIVAAAAAEQAKALVIECMALAPELQALSEWELVRATHAVVTNARPDHLDVMGPTDEHVARALAGTTPVGGKLYTAEQKQLEVFREAARDRGTELVALGPEQTASVSEDELALFAYTEHADNVALALRVCADLGVEREVALRGMQHTVPDPGALRDYVLDFHGRRIVFVNGFAANDRVSSEQLWNLARARHPELATRIILFNCRADRPERSRELGEALPAWPRADRVIVVGSGTYLFSRAATRAGLDAAKMEVAEDQPDEEIFERVVSQAGDSALVMGMGNIGGQGLSLVRYFANRTAPRSAEP
jgi:gamma-polyglutamate synthase